VLPAPNISLPHTLPRLPGPHKLPSLASLNRMPDLSHVQASNFHLQPGDPTIVLDKAFEVFDAADGILMAWG
jgi:hypothetical protein